jgi:hypothetical protein
VFFGAKNTIPLSTSVLMVFELIEFIVKMVSVLIVFVVEFGHKKSSYPYFGEGV